MNNTFKSLIFTDLGWLWCDETWDFHVKKEWGCLGSPQCVHTVYVQTQGLFTLKIPIHQQAKRDWLSYKNKNHPPHASNPTCLYDKVPFNGVLHNCHLYENHFLQCKNCHQEYLKISFLWVRTIMLQIPRHKDEGGKDLHSCNNYSFGNLQRTLATFPNMWKIML